ncbi:hypothetical protein quinque_009775 [Culex quinquefasciatus]
MQLDSRQHYDDFTDDDDGISGMMATERCAPELSDEMPEHAPQMDGQGNSGNRRRDETPSRDLKRFCRHISAGGQPLGWFVS